MPDITELEQRIAAAFDRIDLGLDRLARAKSAAPPAPDVPPDNVPPDNVPPENVPPENVPPALDAGPHMAALLRALESAKASSADWAERYRALEIQSGDETVAMAGEIARLTALLEAAQSAPPAPMVELEYNDDQITQLTARIAAQEAELEALRALRAVDAEEVGDLIAALAPLVEEVPHV